MIQPFTSTFPNPSSMTFLTASLALGGPMKSQERDGTMAPTWNMRELIDYLHDKFDWRAQEKVLNQFAHFRAVIMASASISS